MLPNTCRSVAGNGQPCRCFAVRHSQFCRHHQPPAPKTEPAHPMASGSPDTLTRPMTQAELTAAWRLYYREIRRTKDLDSLRKQTELILAALGFRRISHRSAGRLLQAIHDRRTQLLESQIKAQLIVRQYVEAIEKAEQAKRQGLCHVISNESPGALKPHSPTPKR